MRPVQVIRPAVPAIALSAVNARRTSRVRRDAVSASGSARARILVLIAVGVERYRFGCPQAGDLLVAQGCADLLSTRLDQTDNDGAPVGKSACAGQAFGDDGVERGLDLAVSESIAAWRTASSADCRSASATARSVAAGPAAPR